MSHTRSAEPPGAGLSLSEPQSEPGARTAEPAASSMPLCHGQTIQGGAVGPRSVSF